MKILHIGPNYLNHRGGIGGVIALYKKYIPNFYFLTTYEGNRSKIINLIIFPYLIICIAFKTFTKDIKMVHIHGASNGSFFRKYITFLFAKLLHRKTIYHIHGGGFYKFFLQSSVITKWMISHFINNADCVICLSKSWYEIYRTNFSPRRLEILPNFVTRRFEEITISEGKTIFLFLGKIMKAKGVYDLLDIVEEIKDNHGHDFELWIGGNGEIEKMKDIIASKGIYSQVRFLGWVNNSEKEEVLKKADVYVLPSYAEGLPLSILEAMSFGMPVISTTVGGIPELVEQNVSGYLFEAGDKHALKTAVRSFLKDKSLIYKMGIQSKKIIADRYCSEVVINKLNSIYDSMLSK